MTNEEAKSYIMRLLERGGSDGFDYKEEEALDLAIKALEQTSEDYVSREAVVQMMIETIRRIEQIRDKDKNAGEYPYNRCIEIVREVADGSMDESHGR